MKMKVSWYENNLINMQKSAIADKKQIEELKSKLDTLNEWIYFLEYQIEEAKRIGKKEFDADKFRVKR